MLWQGKRLRRKTETSRKRCGFFATRRCGGARSLRTGHEDLSGKPELNQGEKPMNTDRNHEAGVPPAPDDLSRDELAGMLAWLESDDADERDTGPVETGERGDAVDRPSVTLSDDVRRMITRQVRGVTRSRAALLRLPGFEGGEAGSRFLAEAETQAMLAVDGELREFTVRWRRSTEVDGAVVLQMEDCELSRGWEPIVLTAGEFTWPHHRGVSSPLVKPVRPKWRLEQKPSRPAENDRARADLNRAPGSPAARLHGAAKGDPGWQSLGASPAASESDDNRFGELFDDAVSRELTAYADACGETTAVAAVDLEWPTDDGPQHMTQVMFLRTAPEDSLARGRLVGTVRLEVPANIVAGSYRATVRDLRPDDLAWFTSDDLIEFLPDQDRLTHLPLESAEGGWRFQIRHDFQREALTANGGQALLRLVAVQEGGVE
jgi:hypothetical protein